MVLFGADLVLGIVVVRFLGIRDYVNKRVGGVLVDIISVREIFIVIILLLLLLEYEGFILFLRKINLGKVSIWYWIDLEGEGIMCVV